MNTDFSRRQFLKLSALAAGATTLGFPAILRAQNTGTKLNIACIGLGLGRGRGLVREAMKSNLVNIIALCDVDSKHLDYAKAGIAITDPSVKLDSIKLYSDYRKLLADEKNLDAVIIATPDHWHALIAKASLFAGKHVYCEKPLTHTISEARELRTLAAQTKRITQMGNQGSSNINLRRGIEIIQAGALGKVLEVHCWAEGVGCSPGLALPTVGDPVPPNLNWDEWVGPAPERLYKDGYYHPWNWRGWLDFGSGPIGDFGCHNMNLPVRALKLDYPVEIDIDAKLMGLPTYPQQARIDYHFAQRGDLSPVTLSWYDGGRRPDPALIPKELTDYFNGQETKTVDNKTGKTVTNKRHLGDGVLILGENGFTFGNCWNGSDYIFLKGDPKLWGVHNHPACKNIPETLPKSPGHMKEWVEACLGGKPVFSDFETGGHLTEIALSGVVALKVGKKLAWDGPAMKATNAPEADQYIQAQYRKGWI
ncbi:MAG: Gfo/Idh/MocA family oxidoreductase [Verrucomicrobiae bacterium]